jgi:hypothetical protein
MVNWIKRWLTRKYKCYCWKSASVELWKLSRDTSLDSEVREALANQALIFNIIWIENCGKKTKET